MAGQRAAVLMLSRPDVQAVAAYVAENGNLAVWWAVRGIGPRAAFRCQYPGVITWVPRHGWADGIRAEAVRAWLLAEMMRGPTETGTGLYVSRSHCARRSTGEQSPALLVDGRGQLSRVRTSARTEPPRPDAVAVRCESPLAGGCQLDPRTREQVPLGGALSWSGTWHDRTSVLWKASSHISGTWSVDGGRTWNQFMDVWNASPFHRGGATVAVSNASPGTRNRHSWFGVLAGGHRRGGYVEWSPTDVVRRHPLPRSIDGYRWWEATPDGVLVGSGRRGGVYVSSGRNWKRVVRRDTGPCPHGADLAGRFLVCGPQRSGDGPGLEVRISDDLGVTWTTILLEDVVPRGAERLGKRR